MLRPPRREDTVPVGSVKVRSHSSGHALSGEGSWLRSHPVKGQDTVLVVSVKVRSQNSGHILSEEGSRLRSRPVRGGVTAQVTSCQGSRHGSVNGLLKPQQAFGSPCP